MRPLANLKMLPHGLKLSFKQPAQKYSQIQIPEVRFFNKLSIFEKVFKYKKMLVLSEVDDEEDAIRKRK